MLRGMPTELLRAIHGPLLEEVSGLELTDAGLRGELDLRYGLVPFQIDHDAEAEALRVSVRLPPPAGGGPDFLVWCLALNGQYWDAKLGLDEDGFLLVHADVDERAERRDVRHAAFEDHAGLQVLEILDAFRVARRHERGTRIAAGFLELLQDVAHGRHAELLVREPRRIQSAQETAVADHAAHVAAGARD